MTVFDQTGFDVRFEWGQNGLRALLSATDVVVIVDVLSFSTSVDVAVSRGASVLPFAARDSAAATAFAARERALLAAPYRTGANVAGSDNAYSLSPASLQHIRPGTRLVLPSPNGSALSRTAAEAGRTVFTGCLRNASAVAAAARAAGKSIAVIAAGERWPDGSLRPAFEDLVGAGAILSALAARVRSPDAEAAAAAFQHVQADLGRCLIGCASGRELVEAGFAEDVRLAAELDASPTAPWLDCGAGAFGVYAPTA